MCLRKNHQLHSGNTKQRWRDGLKTSKATILSKFLREKPHQKLHLLSELNSLLFLMSFFSSSDNVSASPPLPHYYSTTQYFSVVSVATQNKNLTHLRTPARVPHSSPLYHVSRHADFWFGAQHFLTVHYKIRPFRKFVTRCNFPDVTVI